MVREVLDRLAPDDAMKTAGVAFEKDRSDFTRKAEGSPHPPITRPHRNCRKVPEESVRLIEELTASLA